MKKKFTWLLLPAVLSSSLPLMAQNFAVSLDGATNSVTIPAQLVPASADFTVEFWAYVPALDATNHEFVSQGTVGSGAGSFYIGYDPTGQIRVGDNWTATGVQIPVGAWFHLALTYFNTTTTATLYIDDVIKASNPAFSFTGGGQNFAIGQQTDGTELFPGEMDELNVWSVARTQNSIKNSMLRGLFTTDPTYSSVIAYYQMNDGSGNTLTNTSNTAGINGTINGTISGSTWASSPIDYALNGLSFDGVSDDKVVVPSNGNFDALSSATIELDVNPGSSAGSGDMVGVRGVGGTKFDFSIFNNGALIMYNGVVAPSGVGVALTAGTWYHISFVVDGVMDTTGVFVDGNYIDQIPLGFGTQTGQPLVLGVSQNPGSDAEFFTGTLDDVRIWNTMLTQAQIQANMNNEMVGNEPGLLAEYTFDQGIAGGNNSFLTTAYDNTGNNLHGTLSNFSLSGGTTANFVTGATLTPLPVIFTNFTAQPEGKEVLLKWQTGLEENSRDFAIERSPTGAANSFTSIGTVPAAGHSSTKRSYSFNDVSPLTGQNYYRLLETDLDGHSMFSPLQEVTFAGTATDHFARIGVNSIEVDFVQGNNNNYVVTDILGRTIQQGQMSSGRIYLDNVPMGVYVVKMISPNGAQRSIKVLVN